MWHCTRKQWESLHREVRIIRRAGGDVTLTAAPAQEGVRDVAMGRTVWAYHQPDPSVLALFDDTRPFDTRRRSMDRLRFYADRGTHFATEFASRLP